MLGVKLLREGLIAPHAIVQALSLQHRHRGRLNDVLLSRDLITEPVLYAALARYWNVQLIDPAQQPPDPRLIDQIGAAFCLREGILPYRRVGHAVLVATAHPEEFSRHSQKLHEAFGNVMMVLAPSSKIETAIFNSRRQALSQRAENRVCATESCRGWGKNGVELPIALLLSLLMLGLWLSPIAVAAVFTLWAVTTLVLLTGLRAAAFIASLSRPASKITAPIIAQLPTVSVMVALYKESNIAQRLIRRLGQLEYPRDLLDILLVVEEEDHVTRDALRQVKLPVWMRVVVVPHGQLKTKPRALNFALDLCRGSIVGVYDAEDAPEPDQIKNVVQRFYQRGADVACLQGVLDFYNPTENWLARCFTLEYATWFRVILPGLQRLGLALPLGGTTLFFRRSALEQLGAWDAHNVTEDADLGIRLARHGYRTEMIETVTYEEANCEAIPWVKQRSRWLKGYMMTWAVHMRDPALLWQQLGPKRFIGFQILFLCTSSQFLLAPVLWSFWVLPLGFAHPFTQVLPNGAITGLLALYIVTDVVNFAMTALAMQKTNHKMSWLWIPTLHLYFPLGALASYKAAWEMITKPFYWDKTSHGQPKRPNRLTGL